jgi:hypothetical protein
VPEIQKQTIVALVRGEKAVEVIVPHRKEIPGVQAGLNFIPPE